MIVYLLFKSDLFVLW